MISLATLKRMEWAATETTPCGDRYAVCPDCAEREVNQSHDASCELKAEIDRLEKAEQGAAIQRRISEHLEVCIYCDQGLATDCTWSHDERLGDGMLLRNAAAALTALARDLADAKAKLARWEGDGGLLEAVQKLSDFGPEWPDHGNAPLAIAASYALLARDLAAARQERDAALAEIAEARRVLWLAHRHKGIYGDDGEMQCGECAENPPGERGTDYKRDPLPLSAISAARSLQRHTDAAVRAARAETLRKCAAAIREGAFAGGAHTTTGHVLLGIADKFDLAAREGQ